MKLLLFDIDGTLLLDGGASTRALDQTFVDFFKISDASTGITKHGLTDSIIAQQTASRVLGRELTADEFSELAEQYLSHLEQDVATNDSFTILPGVEDLLPALSRPDVLLGLQTGNMERGAKVKLKRANFTNYFLFGGFGSDAHTRKEIVSVAIERGQQASTESVMEKDIFLIGDSPYDVQAGHQNGIQTIAVATSIYSPDELLEEKPSYFFPDLSDTEGFLQLLDFA